MEKLSHEELVKRAVIMEALNIATSGELVRTALGNPSKPRRARRTKNPFAKIRKALNEP